MALDGQQRTHQCFGTQSGADKFEVAHSASWTNGTPFPPFGGLTGGPPFPGAGKVQQQEAALNNSSHQCSLNYCVVAHKPSGAMYTRAKTLPTNPVGGEKESEPSLDMPKRILEATTQSERAKQRQRLGTLRDLTVQPATRARYSKAIDDFLSFLSSNRIELPKQRACMDDLLCGYLEHLSKL